MDYLVKCVSKTAWDFGKVTDWINPSQELRAFRTEGEAYLWAEERSKSMQHGINTVYQVFYDNKPVGFPYYRGEVLKNTVEKALYKLHWRTIGAELWESFDAGKPNKTWDLEGAIKRSRACKFNPDRHEVRVYRNNYVAFEGATSTADLIAWLERYAGKINELPPVNQPVSEKESDMHISKPLNVKTKTIIKKIEDHEKARKAKHDERVAKTEAESAKRLDALTRIFEAGKGRFLFQLDQGYSSKVTELVFQVVAENMTDEQIVAKVEKWNVAPGLDAFTPDKDAEKIISVLTAAEDTTVEVTTDSDLYRYL